MGIPCDIILITQLSEAYQRKLGEHFVQIRPVCDHRVGH